MNPANLTRCEVCQYHYRLAAETMPWKVHLPLACGMFDVSTVQIAPYPKPCQPHFGGNRSAPCLRIVYGLAFLQIFAFFAIALTVGQAGSDCSSVCRAAAADLRGVAYLSREPRFPAP